MRGISMDDYGSDSRSLHLGFTLKQRLSQYWTILDSILILGDQQSIHRFSLPGYEATLKVDVSKVTLRERGNRWPGSHEN